MSSFIAIIEVEHADGEYHPPIVAMTPRVGRTPLDDIAERLDDSALKQLSEAGSPRPTKVTMLLEQHRCDLEVDVDECLGEVISEAATIVELSAQDLLKGHEIIPDEGNNRGEQISDVPDIADINRGLSKQEVCSRFGFDPESIGLRHRDWFVEESGKLWVRARDGGCNRLDTAALKRPNFCDLYECDFDVTFCYYVYDPLPHELNIYEGELTIKGPGAGRFALRVGMEFALVEDLIRRSVQLGQVELDRPVRITIEQPEEVGEHEADDE